MSLDVGAGALTRAFLDESFMVLMAYDFLLDEKFPTSPWWEELDG